MKSMTAPKLRILITIVALLSLNKFTEGKVRLVPKGKKNKKQQLLRKRKQTTKQQTKGAQVVLKPKRKEAANLQLQLQATIGKNEKGEHVLLLSDESSAAVTSAMQSSQVAQEKQQATEPAKQAVAVEAPVEKAEAPQEQQVLFYDPAELKTAAGEVPLPKRVFDADGNEVDMAGKQAILVLPPKDKHPPKEEGEHSPPPAPEHEETTTSTSSSKTEERMVYSTPQSEDQMIIVGTVATMALFVGALSARRLRSRQFLSFCIENESLEDELAYDAAYTTQSTVGASSFYAGAGYDTFGGSKYGGDLRWRGDLEKFDV